MSQNDDDDVYYSDEQCRADDRKYGYAYRDAAGAPCDCGDLACPVPAWLPQKITVAIAEPAESAALLQIRVNGFKPEQEWRIKWRIPNGLGCAGSE